MKKIISFIVGLTILFIIGLIIFRTLSWIYNQILSIDPRISAALITGFLTIVATSLTITVPKLIEKRMEIEEQHRNQKIPMYQELLQFLFQLLMGQKTNGKHLEEREIIEFMSKFTQNLILWGSNDVIKKYSEYRTYFSNRGVGKETSIKEIELLEDLLLAIRKDMGHNNKSLRRGDVLSFIYQRYRKISI